MTAEEAEQLIVIEARFGRGRGGDLARSFFKKRGRRKRLGAWRRYWRAFYDRAHSWDGLDLLRSGALYVFAERQ